MSAKEQVPLLSENSYDSLDFTDMITSSKEDNEEAPVFTGIVCAFVIFFDLKKGNKIEWEQSCIAAPLEGIEFRAMPSGLHKLETDYVLFRQGGFYGIACFHNLKTGITAERGARLRSVGVLCRDYRSLAAHYLFLSKEVRLLNENPGSFSSLQAYFEKNQDKVSEDLSISSSALFRPVEDVFVDEVSSYVGSIVALLNLLQENTLLIWKALLLRKRIMMFSEVPIGVVCARANACAQLLEGALNVRKVFQQPKRLYYVNLYDYSLLEKTKFYIACTSEKIFESKTSLYDVYIDVNQVKVMNLQDNTLLKPSSKDKYWFNKMRECTSFGDQISQERFLKKVFSEMNGRVLQFIARYAGTTVLAEDIEKNSDIFDLSDIPFIRALSNVLDAKITVDLPSGYCCSVNSMF